MWANIGAILADAGMGFADLIKITILLTDKAYILPSRAARDKALGDFLQQVHEVLNAVLMLTLAGHVAVALWHHFVVKDDTLRRMR